MQIKSTATLLKKPANLLERGSSADFFLRNYKKSRNYSGKNN